MSHDHSRAERGRAGSALGATALGMGAATALIGLAVACIRKVAHTGFSDAWVGTMDVAGGLELIAIAAAGAVAAWLAVLLLIGSAAALPGRTAAPLRALARTIAPALAPRIAGILITTVVALVPLGTAHADTGSPATGSVLAADTGGGAASALVADAGSSAGSEDLSSPPPLGAPGNPAHPGIDVDVAAPEPGWRPTGPAATPGAATVDLVSRGSAIPDSVVVRAGDTLWDITARYLGPDADAATIAASWPRWHAANRGVIGADPDLILPGTTLIPPTDEAAQMAPDYAKQVAP